MKLGALKHLLNQVEADNVIFLVRMRDGNLYCSSDLEGISIEPDLPNTAKIRIVRMLKEKE